MANVDWKYKSVRELTVALAARDISACELAEVAIARIESLDPKLNAVCVRDFDRALNVARAADDVLAMGERRPLLGIPLLVKESFNVAGLPTTWGFPQHKDFVPTEDALPVARVKAAGGVVWAKRTFRSASETGRATTTSMGRPTIPSTLAALLAARRAGRPPRLPQAMCRSRLAPISADRCGCRRISVASPFACPFSRHRRR